MRLASSLAVDIDVTSHANQPFTQGLCMKIPFATSEPASASRSLGSGPSRRQLLGALAVLPLARHLPVRADDTGPIKLAQSTALSGPLGDLGQALHQGAKACFDATNANGGVNGRLIELTVADDGYDVKRS